MSELADSLKEALPKAKQEHIDALAKTYALVMSKPDTRTIAFSDKDEVATVRENFLKKKLGVKGTDEELDAAIVEVGKSMKGNNRVVAYYHLAEKFSKLSVFEA